MNLVMMLALLTTGQTPADFNLVGTKHTVKMMAVATEEKPPVVVVPIPAYTKVKPKVFTQEAPQDEAGTIRVSVPREDVQEEPTQSYRVVRRYMVTSPVTTQVYSAPLSVGANCANGSCSVSSSSSMGVSAPMSMGSACAGGSCAAPSSQMRMMSPSFGGFPALRGFGASFRASVGAGGCSSGSCSQ
jgi:hypothetical protein